MKSIITLFALLAVSTAAHANPVDDCAAELACCSDDASCDEIMNACLDTAFAEAHTGSKAKRLLKVSRALRRVDNDETFECEEDSTGGRFGYDIDPSAPL